MKACDRILSTTPIRSFALCCLAVACLVLPIPAADADGPLNHWAFQPVVRSEPPAVQSGQKADSTNPIDRFVFARLQSKQLKPSPPASRQQLIRRVTFDLIGLPPTPEAIDAFEQDSSPQAYEQLIDRLLASPQYGERWARHWLDLVRYAESDGFEHDALRPHSWRYRDYVVHAFNTDKPYDQFIREQIAGDELAPGDPQFVIATAFNLLGPDMVDSADQLQRRLNTLNDAVDTTASAFLGITLGCARCHNHKFEPFTQQDYYSMQAFYAGASFEQELPVPTSAQRTAHTAAMSQYRLQADSTQKQLDALETPYRTRLHEEKMASLSEDAQLAHRTPKAKRTAEQEGTVQETAPSLKITDAELLKSLEPADKARRRELIDVIKKISKPAPLPVTMALKTSNGPPPKTFVLLRGDYNNPGDEVNPAVPAILRGRLQENPAANAMNRRTALAHWIASTNNPLTTRVIVNRLWQHHFERGLVATPSDFGTRGTPPTHPELLDWLASEFVARGWSIKAMHKLILLSATYQQSSVPAADALARDPENRLLSRQNRVRLEGEVIRDGLLAISGRLNPSLGGPPVSPPIPSEITRTSKNWTTSVNPADHTRRSLYILARRNLRFPFLEVFDAPDSNLTCPERGRSTTAPQSLTLLNSDEIMTASKATAERLLKNFPSIDQRMDYAFRLIAGRAPNATEKNLTREFLEANHHRRELQGASIETTAKTSGAVAEWSEFCRALFNLNAFVYVD